jgi:DNA polymerase
VDLPKTNVTKYSKDKSFEVMIICYSLDHGPIETIDLMDKSKGIMELQGKLNKLKALLCDPNIIKVAHNATFEMTCLHNYFGIPFNPREWQCTMNMAYLLNLPGKLGHLSNVLSLEKGKLDTGKNLITYFCKPCKPTKINGMRERNYPNHAPDKWADFKGYCARDVEAEMELYKRVSWIWDELPEWEKEVCYLDYKINFQGVKIDLDFVRAAADADHVFKERIKERVKDMTQLENPNSYTQLKKWVTDLDPSVDASSLDKAHVKQIIEQTNNQYLKVLLSTRKLLAKTSTAKYVCALECESNGYFNNTLAYQGTITGRWAGRKIQIHNLPKNKLDDIEYTRNKYLVKDEYFLPYSECIPYELSQLLRTMFVPEPGNHFSSVQLGIKAFTAAVLPP